MINLEISELKELTKFKQNIFLAPDETLYKICRDPMFISAEYEEFLIYVNNLPKINGLLQPLDLLCDGHFYGYQMDFIKGFSLDALISKNMLNYDEWDIKELIKQLFLILQNINKYFIFSDIRNANILVDKNNLTFIDWDLGRKIGDNKVIPTYYDIVYGKKVYPVSILTDNIKAFICALSLYYNMSFEKFIVYKCATIEEIKDILLSVKADYRLIDYIKYLIDQLKKDETIVDLYFNDIVDDIKLPSKREKRKIKKL